MRIVVTGSSSFIGGVLKRQCERAGIEWHGIDVADGGIDICSNELPGALPEKADAIVHLAAISRDGDCRCDPAGALRVNLSGTQNVIDAARAKGIRQIIFASTEWVYGDSGTPVGEDSVIDAASIFGEYALTKLAGERLLAIAARGGALSATVLRFGIVYGPRPANWSAVESLYESVRTRDHVQVGSLRSARRFIHVEDIARGITASVGRRGFEVFNLTGPELVTLGDIITESAGLLGRSPAVTERAPDSVSIRDIRNALACRELRWRPEIGLRAGLESLSS